MPCVPAKSRTPGAGRFGLDLAGAPFSLGELGAFRFAGINPNMTYNQRLQPVEIKAWSTAGVALDLSYNFNVGVAETYTHDDLARLASANCGSLWSQTFTYDPFGNLSKSGTMSFQPAYSWTTNHITTISGFTATYDSDGDVTNDGLNTFTWDAYGKPITANSVALTFDALGRMVE